MGLETIFLIAVLVMSVVIHEVSHGYAANFLGDPTARLAGRLTLNPLKHLDPIGSIIVPGVLLLLGGFVFGWAKPVPYNPYNLRAGKWGPAYVAAAGPASNLLIALVFSLILRFTATASLLSAGATQFVGMIVLLNIMLAIFNLIPVAPLDGSKILFALIPDRSRWIEEWLLQHQLLVLIFFLLIILNSGWLDQIVSLVFHLFTGASI